MDPVTYAHSAKQAQRIERFIENPDSTSGVLTQPKVIEAGETVTIKSGRQAILADTVVDGNLVIEAGADVFVPAGAGFSDLDQRIDTIDNRTINGVSFGGSANISVGLDNQSSILSTSSTLNTVHKNKMLLCNGTFNLTLPTVGTIKSGDLFIINNIGTGVVSLVANGNNTDLSRLTILAGEVLILQSDGGSFYRFVSRSKDFASNINVTAGYTYLPNRVIMQWGRLITSIAPGGTLNITFPTTFPTDVFYSNVAVVTASTNNQITTPFAVATSLSNLAIANNDVDSTITQIRWFSIGY